MVSESMKSQLDELRRLASGARNRRTETGIPRVASVQGQVPEHELGAVYEPMINLILRGTKLLTIGSQTLRYDPTTYFVMTVDLPATGSVHPDDDGQPYLSVALTLDPQIIGAIVRDISRWPEPAGLRGFSTAPVSPELLDAWVRLMRLTQRPDDIAGLAPVYEREILYRVLQGPQGWLVRDIALPDTDLARVRRAIHWIRAHYAEPIRVETLADMAMLSASAFHRHFKAATSMTPVQFQKKIRLLRARELLTAAAGAVSSVAFEVGYESASQFTREYARLFGQPPARDRARIRRDFGKVS